MVADSTQKVYTVTMRGDAKWHDGKPVTAQDVVFTINLIKNPATRSPLRVNWLDISATALNDTTVQFTLPAVYAAFPQALTFPIMPMHLLKSLDPSAVRESVFSQSPVGSGPFKFSRLQQIDSVTGQKVVHLVANTKYYAGRPKLDRFELRSYPTEASLIRAVNNGEVSGASDISVTGIKDVKTKQATVTSEPVDSGVYLLLNTQNPVLKETPVRQALQLATNTADIRKALGGGVLPLDGPLLESQLTGANIPHAPAADVAKANQMLESNGWKLVNGYRVKDGQTLQLGITTTKDSEYEAVLKQVEAQWRKVGVKVATNVIDTSSATSTFVQNVLQARNFDVLLYELSIGADPDVYAYWHSSQIGMSGYNFSNYSSRIVDASLASARSRLEPDLRNAKYSLFVQQWLADVPAVALYQPAVEYVTASGAQAVRPGGHLVTLADRYADVQYWTVENGSVYKTP
jgi:peptide/nickel transport system substrate-binding protein